MSHVVRLGMNPGHWGRPQRPSEVEAETHVEAGNSSISDQSLFYELFFPDYLDASKKPLNELSPPETTAMTSNATLPLSSPGPAYATSSVTATPASDNDEDHIQPADTTPEHSDGDAHNAPTEENTTAPQNEVQMGGLQNSGNGGGEDAGDGGLQSQGAGINNGLMNLLDIAHADAHGNPYMASFEDCQTGFGKNLRSGAEGKQRLQEELHPMGTDNCEEGPAFVDGRLFSGLLPALESDIEVSGGHDSHGMSSETMGPMNIMAAQGPTIPSIENPFSGQTTDWFEYGPLQNMLSLQSQQYGNYFNPPAEPSAMDIADQEVQGFAKIEFEDGHFYLNSYSLKIGRDVTAQKLHMRQMEREKSHHKGGHSKAKSMVSEKAGFVRDFDQQEIHELERDRRKRRRERDRSSSRPDKRLKTPRSSGSSSQHRSRRLSMVPPSNTNQRFYQSNVEEPARVEVEKHTPSPHRVATLLIHPLDKDNLSAWKGISRDHLLIEFNFDKTLWEAHVRGVNGCFVDQVHHQRGETFALKNGDSLQIGAVLMLWRLPEHIPEGGTGAEQYKSSDDGTRFESGSTPSIHRMHGKEMSLEFLADRRADPGVSSESYDDDHDMNDYDMDDHDDDDDIEYEEGEIIRGEEAGETTDYNEIFETNRHHVESDGEDAQECAADEDKNRHEPAREEDLEMEEVLSRPKKAPPVKKRGAGRPPKGEKSKRQEKEERLAAQAAAKTADKAKAAQQAVIQTAKEGENGATEPKVAEISENIESATLDPANTANKTVPDGEIKRKVGRPRKHPKPDTPPEPRQKRKYTKRKPKELKDGEQKDGEQKDGEQIAEGATGDDKGKKLVKAKKSAKSPPAFCLDNYPDRSTFAPGELIKPQITYVTLIYDALTESKSKALTLPEIYNAIAWKHAYFAHGAQTNGWQSSVRHNLGQNDGFYKVSRCGKGWRWGVKPGATFEKERKRKASPPPQHHPGMQQLYPNTFYNGPPVQGYPPQGYPPQGYPPQGYPPQGNPPQGNPPQGYPSQGMIAPPQGSAMPSQNFQPGQQPFISGPMGHPQSQLNGNFHPGPHRPMTHIPTLIPPALAPPANRSYSSPYATKPPVSNESPANVQGPPANTQEGPPAPEQKSNSQMAPALTTSPPNAHQSPHQPQAPYPPPPQHTTQAYAVQPQMYPEPQPPPQYSPSPYQTIKQPLPPQAQSQALQNQPGTSAPAPALAPAVAPPVAPLIAAPVDERVSKAITSFKKILSEQLAPKENGLESLENAVQKVMGQIPDDTPGFPKEKYIVEVLRDMLKKIGLRPPGPPGLSEEPSQTQSTQHVLPPQYQANHSGTQARGASQPPANPTGAERSTPTITRPSFHAHSPIRPSGTPVPRPSMNPKNGLARKDSNSSVAPPAGSATPPVVISLANGASAPKLSQIAQVESEGSQTTAQVESEGPQVVQRQAGENEGMNQQVRIETTKSDLLPVITKTAEG
ncbi:hypothetical protein MBM_08096 [Drepanopeziza brunnea f. sp. 'multigermtubi' MB_m1]|uniref:Fork-head domain-containing protein n=1 Tax=Marssonina brunnea f. sp. multigermtubi (strain MB_m1) TaxID=1072389 RepID=K1W9G9_MARBU|nr:uncharacterized protein MBM_08096 [Drepanopeziza brunnea f. sp. 'multigermtubi' MB_m1]EKD13895.1 hypothetical protein MBM_08096 [Drepanopeziza brunnea f. sp. 'multigermtubi' MB_m1]